MKARLPGRVSNLRREQVKQTEPYEPPTVEEIEAGGLPISTAPGTSIPQ
jgi:hypothetical protein